MSSEDFVADARALLAERSNELEVLRIGDTAGARATAAQTFESYYETSMVAHVPMEPMSALAHFSDGKLHLYSGHQIASLLPTAISNFTGLDPQNIIFHPHLIGGGFGKRNEFEPLILSSIAAIQMKMPVKVIFTREDDMAFAHPRTPTVQHLQGFVDADNNLSGTTHDIAGGSIVRWSTREWDFFLEDLAKHHLQPTRSTVILNFINGFSFLNLPLLLRFSPWPRA